MKTFSERDFELAREWAESQGFPKEEKFVKSDSVEIRLAYFVMPKSICPELPNFVWQCAVEDDSKDIINGVYGVSEETPEEFRPYPILHEQLELSLQGRICPCLGALDYELRAVPEELKRRYLPFRRDFFRDLVKYAEEHNYKPIDIAGFRESFKHLDELCSLGGLE
ncbi:hypothetical protein J4447_01260 [Candidatus Pacearchaeota archaeon]|nr:hypothetical protein [Candidatus Pacearchaeota archaeon]